MIKTTPFEMVFIIRDIMRDFPVFTTEHGVASLIFREIPYRGIAYIRLRDASEPVQFLQECVDFCRAAGAERVYATGHTVLEKYPLYTAIWKLSATRDLLPETDAVLLPVTKSTLLCWQELYNQKMANIPNSAYMTRENAEELVKRGDGYFILKNNERIGIGMASADKINGVISLRPGAGKEVVAALNRVLTGETVTLEVASANEKAVRLYESLGFTKTEEIARWYCLI